MSSISGIGSVASATSARAASDGDSAAVEAKESAATKMAEKLNGGTAPKTSSTASQQTNLTKLRMYANQHMPVTQIAELMGVSISAVMQQASAAGINLGATGSSSSAASSAVKVNPAVGNNVNTTA